MTSSATWRVLGRHRWDREAQTFLGNLSRVNKCLVDPDAERFLEKTWKWSGWIKVTRQFSEVLIPRTTFWRSQNFSHCGRNRHSRRRFWNYLRNNTSELFHEFQLCQVEPNCFWSSKDSIKLCLACLLDFILQSSKQVFILVCGRRTVNRYRWKGSAVEI